MNGSKFLCGPLLVALMALGAGAQEPSREAASKVLGNYGRSSRVGDTVVVIKNTQARQAERTVANIEMGQRFHVQAVQSEWLWPDHAKPGWIPQQDVLPLDEAAGHFTRLISQSPNDPRVFRARGSVWMGKEDWDRAIADLDEVIRLSPTDHFAFRERGLAWQKKEQFDRAIADFDQAIRFSPQTAMYHMNRGAALENKGEFAAAMADFNQAVTLDPDHAGPYNNRAWLLAVCPDAKWRNGARAVRDASKACEISSWSNFTHLGTLAAAYAESGDFSLAVRWQIRALELAPPAKKLQWQARLEAYRAGQQYRHDGAW